MGTIEKVLNALRGVDPTPVPGCWVGDGVFMLAEGHGHPPAGRCAWRDLPAGFAVYAGVRHPSRRGRWLPVLSSGRLPEGRVWLVAELHFGRAHVGLFR